MAFSFGEEVCSPAFDKPDAALTSYGLPFADACKKHISDTFHCSRAYVIASKGLLAKSNALSKLQGALKSRIVGIKHGIRPHTPWDDCVEAVQAARQTGADCLITVGAGSITDAGKLIRFALANDVKGLDDLDTLWGGKRSRNPNQRRDIRQSSMPLICIPTSLSGGEYQALAGATDPRNHQKKGFEPAKMPDLIILDPELCKTTPEQVWLSTGVRSVDHCVETLCTLDCDDYAARNAVQGLKRLVRSLLATKLHPDSLDARFQSQLGVIDAMCSRSTGVPLGASYGIGQALGSVFNVSHGETSCIMLPAVCKYNAQKGANVEQQQKVADVLLAEPSVAQLVKDDTSKTGPPDLGDTLNLILRALGLHQTLTQVGVGRGSLQAIAQHSLSNVWVKANPLPHDDRTNHRDFGNGGGMKNGNNQIKWSYVSVHQAGSWSPQFFKDSLLKVLSHLYCPYRRALNWWIGFVPLPAIGRRLPSS